ncbi:MAG: hypothetical protein JRF33_06190 [Deltaproteobacteria bacterium]|nr:hypothetical protein [Deltaproteobacteria bacterium]
MTYHGHGSYFRYRWEQLQSEQITDNLQALRELKINFMDLEKTMVYMVSKLALGQSIDLEDPVFKDFLHMNKVDDKHRAALELIAHFSVKKGGKAKLVECPNCHAKIKDVPGVTDEICTWCGHQLHTDD